MSQRRDGSGQARAGDQRVSTALIHGGQMGGTMTTVWTAITQPSVLTHLTTGQAARPGTSLRELDGQATSPEQRKIQRREVDGATFLHDAGRLFAAAAPTAPLVTRVVAAHRWPARCWIGESNRHRPVEWSLTTSAAGIGEIIERLGVPPQELSTHRADDLHEMLPPAANVTRDHGRRVDEGPAGRSRGAGRCPQWQQPIGADSGPADPAGQPSNDHPMGSHPRRVEN